MIRAGASQRGSRPFQTFSSNASVVNKDFHGVSLGKSASCFYSLSNRGRGSAFLFLFSVVNLYQCPRL